MNVFVSRRREYEFGLAFGYWKDWAAGNTVWSIRFAFAKWALVFSFRIKGETE